MQRLIDFYNSPLGRKLVNWGTMSVGLLLASGVIPLDMPIGPFSLGQLLAFIGARMPSVSAQGPSAVVPTIAGTGPMPLPK